MQEKKGITLITGATGGLGGAFASTLAKRQEPIFLTGRSEEKLLAFKQELLRVREGSIIETVACDLTDSMARESLLERVSELCKIHNLPLFRLLNVAGADIQKGLTEYTERKVCFQCRTNFESAVSLSRPDAVWLGWLRDISCSSSSAERFLSSSVRWR